MTFILGLLMMSGASNEKDIVDRRVNSLVADSIKQSLIDEYLKHNPHVQRTDVIAQLIHGDWVIDNISNIIRELFKEREIQNSFQQEQILKEIEMESDDRYRACQQSVKNSRRIIDFLFQSAYASFGLKEKNDHLSFLTQQEARCARVIAQHYKTKKTILEIMAETNPAIPQLKGTMLDYFGTLHQQLDHQFKIYDREVVLNNEFSQYSQDLIKDHFKQIQEKIKDSKKKQQLLTHIVKAYQTLRQNGFFEIENASSLSIDRFNQMLLDFDDRMTKQREELEEIQKIVQALEKVVDYLEASLGKNKDNPHDEPPPKKSSSLRMAFTTKISNLLTRVKGGFRRS